MLGIVFGTLWYRMPATRQDFDEAIVDDLLAVLAPDVAPGREVDPACLSGKF